MRLPSRRRALMDAATAMAAFLVAGTWLFAVSHAESGLLLYAGLGAGAAVMGSAFFTILRRRPPLITPADRVTLVRAVLVACCASMAVPAFLGVSVPGMLFIAVGTVAFLLDAVDGAVARYFGCASPAGARLDVQTDAALVLVLSCAAVGSHGPWVLAIGLMWYLFAVAGWIRPALRGTLTASRLRKAIGAYQPFAFLLALAPGTPHGIGMAALALALVSLSASFSRDIVELERNHIRHSRHGPLDSMARRWYPLGVTRQGDRHRGPAGRRAFPTSKGS
ncbi:phosphatidylglycerophosphate synthase [Arthrobacter pascens]|uniref:CDP-alcohol phosphatidyltransferase family protein n=1 Tax=Arthrobacter pascens TaxID=1677 RepID=UPI0028548BB3|nr:CDP-alcohol phosphatidyltransferase family protein [Arthrobacter pascens]MDR6558071.1 phosphatidylglycerophosphate synthase [Arthrobacter pascens]